MTDRWNSIDPTSELTSLVWGEASRIFKQIFKIAIRDCSQWWYSVTSFNLWKDFGFLGEHLFCIFNVLLWNICVSQFLFPKPFPPIWYFIKFISSLSNVIFFENYLTFEPVLDKGKLCIYKVGLSHSVCLCLLGCWRLPRRSADRIYVPRTCVTELLQFYWTTANRLGRNEAHRRKQH